MDKQKKVDPFQFDKRVAHRFIQSQKVTREDLEKHLAELPDLAEKAEDIAPKIFGESQENAKA
ncbi:MAG: hypothetical protein JKY15_03730 [Deltaproteobacteria bacterium]|nr:hypothetical protein [Deltaproteobacteria bacterium]